jgi:hypothetical protein
MEFMQYLTKVLQHTFVTVRERKLLLDIPPDGHRRYEHCIFVIAGGQYSSLHRE